MLTRPTKFIATLSAAILLCSALLFGQEDLPVAEQGSVSSTLQNPAQAELSSPAPTLGPRKIIGFSLFFQANIYGGSIFDPYFNHKDSFQRIFLQGTDFAYGMGLSLRFGIIFPTGPVKTKKNIHYNTFSIGFLSTFSFSKSDMQLNFYEEKNLVNHYLKLSDRNILLFINSLFLMQLRPGPKWEINWGLGPSLRFLLQRSYQYEYADVGIILDSAQHNRSSGLANSQLISPGLALHVAVHKLILPSVAVGAASTWTIDAKLLNGRASQYVNLSANFSLDFRFYL